MVEHIAAPAMLKGTTNIPLALLERYYEVQNPEIVSPGYLSNNPLDKWLPVMQIGS